MIAVFTEFLTISGACMDPEKIIVPYWLLEFLVTLIFVSPLLKFPKYLPAQVKILLKTRSKRSNMSQRENEISQD